MALDKGGGTRRHRERPGNPCARTRRAANLSLTGFLDALDQQLEQPETHDLAFEERLALLIEREAIYRENRRLARLLSVARLRVAACIEDIDYVHPRGLSKSRMASLAQLEWIGSAMNLCITGQTGCGKTWLACAIGNQACRRGHSTRYVRLPRLLENLRISHGDGSYARLMTQLSRTELLILDDWGMQPLDATQRQDLMEVIEDRHGRHSTLIASQLRSSTGTTTSARRRWRTQSSTDSCTARTGSN